MDAINQITAVSMDSLQGQQDYTLPTAPSMAEMEGLSAQFLDALGEMKAEVSSRADNVELSLSNLTDLSPQKLLQVQMELMQVTLQQELISKGVTKTTQNVESLIKAQ
ncbi:type III secretion system inner rod subunit SctI [Pseudoalteromonas sp. MMG024]|uniref:type III secretion system inner rod subunit SctI n=1 Tax=Pseudoalteromonas sp. MMG024 TaxID=2909980 RepID=UPI001F02153C|nr:type III secretion system inner rod subunit SctI [Pseudoalteromonas sp. MMG024]MCF6455669.1 type III secretion system inner rod subunit SctI [Pseudoalteromonas sp. MMG024]